MGSYSTSQKRTQEFAIGWEGAFPPLSFRAFPPLSPLEVAIGPLKPARASGGALSSVSSPVGIWVRVGYYEI